MTRRLFIAVILVVVALTMRSNALYAVQSPSPTATDYSDAAKRSCKVDEKETDPKKLARQVHCLQNAEHILREKVLVERSLGVAADRMAGVIAAQTNEQNRSKAAALAAEAQAQGSPLAAGNISNATDIPYVGGSAASTATTCGTGRSSPASSLIRVHREILTPDSAKDDFGYRLGKRFAVYQVTVENLSPDFQYMLEDVSVDFSPYFSASAGSYQFSASGQDLTLLRGVPEKGQDYDPRNRFLHIFQGIGTVAAGISGLTSFSDVMGSAVAQFNGPFLNSYTTLLPDHTAGQLNRLSDSAFIANTIINKKSGKTIAMFIPLDEVMSREQQKGYFRDPFEYAGLTGGVNMLYTADVCVDGTFIQTATPVPVLSAATVPKGSAAGSMVPITLTGTDIAQGDTQVLLGGTSSVVIGTVTTSDGKTGSAMVQLPTDYALGTTTATLRSSSNPALTSSTPVKITEQQ